VLCSALTGPVFCPREHKGHRALSPLRKEPSTVFRKSGRALLSRTGILPVVFGQARCLSYCLKSVTCARYPFRQTGHRWGSCASGASNIRNRIFAVANQEGNSHLFWALKSINQPVLMFPSFIITAILVIHP
jgi:hypothetical protein